MLLKHSGIYLFGRGVPAVLNLAAVALYTRLLGPDQYGQYALVFAGALFANAVFFEWLRLALLRFLPSFRARKDVLLSTVLVGYFSLVAMSGIVGALLVLFWPAQELRYLIGLGVGFFWLNGWFEINLELARSQLAPLRYSFLLTVKATLSLFIGGYLAYIGLGPSAILLGLIAGLTVPILWLAGGEWKAARFSLVDWGVLKNLLRYGLPLTTTFALSFVMSSSDRFLLGWLLGTDAAGLYAVGNDLARQSLLVLMMTVNLAAFPLAVRALEERGVEAAQGQMAQNVSLLLAISLPAAAGFALLASNIAEVLLGVGYRSTASSLIPWIVLGTFLAGMKFYYFDLSFFLAKATARQIWVVLAAAVTNVAMNLLLIPRFGVLGAAYANVAAYGLALFLSRALGNRLFPLPLPRKDLLKIMVATAGMAAVLWILPDYKGAPFLVVQVLLGMLVYFSLVYLFDVRNCRFRLAGWLRLERYL